MASRKYPPLRERFFSRVSCRNDGCWNWSGSSFKGGYPQFWHGKKNRKASRVSWEIHRGEIPGGMQVLHRCDNKECTNPDHLYLGDHTQNMRDSVERGRHKRGTGHYMFKRTPELVQKVRELRSQRLKISDICKQLDLDGSTVYLCLGKQGRTGALPKTWYGS